MPDQPTYDILIADRKEGIAVVYERYGKKLYGYAVKNWNMEEDEAWELVYQTIYKIADTIERYKIPTEAQFGSFTFKIFINYLRNHYRDQKRIQEQLNFTSFNELDFEYKEGQPLNGTAHKVKQRLVEQSVLEESEEVAPETPIMQSLKQELEQLKDWERVLLLLRSQNMPYNEIARHIDKPEKQLKVYYQRLKTKLMKKLSQKEEVLIKIPK